MPVEFPHRYYTARQVAESLGISIQKACKLPLDWARHDDGARKASEIAIWHWLKQQELSNP